MDGRGSCGSYGLPATCDGAHGCRNGYCAIVRKHVKVKFRSSVTPSVLIVFENGMGMPVIVGDATGLSTLLIVLLCNVICCR